MSYYTNYNIAICQTDPDTHEMLPLPVPMRGNLFVPQDVITEIENEMPGLSFNNTNEFHGYCKYRDWERIVTELSKQHPDLMFIVTGHGQDNNDHWITWVTAGLSQYEKMRLTHNPFNVESLTPKHKTARYY